MVIVKATKDSEAGVLPDEKLLAEMGKYNEELVKAGVMLAGEGLEPSSPPRYFRMLTRMSAQKRFFTRTGNGSSWPVTEVQALQPSDRCIAHSGH